MRNKCSAIEFKKVESTAGAEQYHVILANINKNVIVDNFSSLVKQLAPAGILLLSGLLAEDEEDIVEKAGKFSLSLREKTEKNYWISLIFSN